jgi:hypothetical protein
MVSWLKCKCGGLINLNMFSGTHIYQLIEDSDYDAVEDPVSRNQLENLFFKKGITVYPCLNCGRLLVEWDEKSGLTVYLPEGKQEIPKAEAAICPRDRIQEDEPKEEAVAEELKSQESDQPDNLQLQEFEALAESAYDGMYDSRSPTGCYSRAKEALYSAIELADQLGRKKDVERLQKRLQHIKDVFRHQFSS